MPRTTPRRSRSPRAPEDPAGRPHASQAGVARGPHRARGGRRGLAGRRDHPGLRRSAAGRRRAGRRSWGLLETEEYYLARLARGPGRSRISRAWGFYPCATTDVLGAWLGFEGYTTTVVTACSSSTIAIGLAGDAIRTGTADLVVTGGADTLSRLTFGGFCSLRAVDPDRCRPFDRGRKGMTLGESAAILVLEEMDRATRRGRGSTPSCSATAWPAMPTT